MKLRRPVCGVLLILALALSFCAPNRADSAGQWVREFYGWYLAAPGDSLDIALTRRARAFSPDLMRAFRAEADAQRAVPNSVGLDFDPLLDTQERCGHYSVGAAREQAGSYFVGITGAGGCAPHSVPDVVAEVVRTGHEWMFVNFHYPRHAQELASADLINVLHGTASTLWSDAALPPGRKPNPDGVDALMPDGKIPRDLRFPPGRREAVIQTLKAEQGSATAEDRRAQRVAFLLAALDDDYARNRDYLLHVLSGCNYPEIRYGCDALTPGYLNYLFEHGHPEVLTPLIQTGIGPPGTTVGSYNAAGSEYMGGLLADLVQNSPAELLSAIASLPVFEQRRACTFAGVADGSGMGAQAVAIVRSKLRMIGSAAALDCLKEIESSSAPH